MSRPGAAGGEGSRSEELDRGHAVLETVAIREGGNPPESLLAAHGTSREPNWYAAWRSDTTGSDQPNAVRRRASQISEIEMRIV